MAAQGEGGLTEKRRGILQWLTDKIHRTDDRVDRLYAQSRTYVINSVKLEELWVSLGEEASAEKMVGAQAGKVFADEVAAALGFESLPEESPPRDDQLFGRQKRQGRGCSGALREEGRGGVVRVEPEFGRDGEPKLRTFTIVWRLGTVGDRIEKHVSETLNASLTTANRDRGGQSDPMLAGKNKGRKA